MSDPQFKFSVPLLREYSAAALTNAGELLEEAGVLLSKGHKARAYFLSVAAIEEAGKAVLAFQGQGRNLRESAVTAKLRRAMEDHSQKITAAFTPILLSSPDLAKAVMPLVDLMIHVKHGREPSMYTDINYADCKVSLPSVVVQDTAAQDCLRLGRDCLGAVRKHLAEKTPEVASFSDDALFAMKSDHLQKILNTEGFWWYYIAQLEAGIQDFSGVVMSYQRDYTSKGRTYTQSR